ncbi:MAG: hypothetical protein DRP58_08985 [Spirochaetes bacterium]|nr:MAG: hypothetical protein DRP58_08985 [Spirochaetota bacterium]
MKTIKDIIELRNRAINEYCDAVKYRGTVNYSRRVSKGIQYILSHLDEEISLDLLAKELEVNPTYFSRLFRKETGITVSQYINTKRINEAGYLLMHTSASIADISLQAGYPDSGYFSRVFHKIKRMTPTEWRNKEKNF